METAFQKLLVSTVERYLNANTQIAYLFAFRVESCTLASLPDILITNDERKLRKIGRRIASDRGAGIGTSEMDGAPGLVWINGVMIWIDVLFLDLMKKATMKLQLMFILMDLFTIAIIPFAFVLKIMHDFKKGLRLIQKRYDNESHSGYRHNQYRALLVIVSQRLSVE